MKHLLREREREELSWLQRLKHALNAGLQPKQTKDPFELDDFVSGLSPETLTKLRRVQGKLESEWAAARCMSMNPVNGKASRWVQAKRTGTPLIRPKVRMQLRRLEELPTNQTNEQPKQDVNGLDDIFPERITSFFQEHKPSKWRNAPPKKQEKSVSPVIIDYQIVTGANSRIEKPKAAESPVKQQVEKQPQIETSVDDVQLYPSERRSVYESLAQNLKNAVAKMLATTQAGPPTWVAQTKTEESQQLESVETMAPVAQAPTASWPTTLLSMISAKLTDFVSKVGPAISSQAAEVEIASPEPVELAEPEFERPFAWMNLQEPVDLSPPRHIESVRTESESLRVPSVNPTLAIISPAAFDMNMRDMQRVPVVQHGEKVMEVSTEKLVEPVFQQTIRELSPRIAGMAAIESQKARSMKSEPARRLNRAQDMSSSLADNSIDYMVRNNRILAQSISNLTERYFQQAALEEAQRAVQ